MKNLISFPKSVFITGMICLALGLVINIHNPRLILAGIIMGAIFNMLPILSFLFIASLFENEKTGSIPGQCKIIFGVNVTMFLILGIIMMALPFVLEQFICMRDCIDMAILQKLKHIIYAPVGIFMGLLVWFEFRKMLSFDYR